MRAKCVGRSSPNSAARRQTGARACSIGIGVGHAGDEVGRRCGRGRRRSAAARTASPQRPGMSPVAEVVVEQLADHRLALRAPAPSPLRSDRRGRTGSALSPCSASATRRREADQRRARRGGRRRPIAGAASAMSARAGRRSRPRCRG